MKKFNTINTKEQNNIIYDLCLLHDKLNEIKRSDKLLTPAVEKLIIDMQNEIKDRIRLAARLIKELNAK